VFIVCSFPAISDPFYDAPEKGFFKGCFMAR
jgi:hypothetical protein